MTRGAGRTRLSTLITPLYLICQQQSDFRRLP